MIVAWTGHRPDLFRDPPAAAARVAATARQLVEHDAASRFVVGGQRGVDTWAAQAAMTLGLPFTLILPLAIPEFADDWPATDRTVLEETVARASVLRIVAGSTFAQSFSERNRRLARSADLLVAIWTRTAGGGTAETIAFARAANVPVREVILEASAAADSAQGRGI